MGEELLGRADEIGDALSALSDGDAGGMQDDTWRRGFRDPENWHDLAERGTPRNG